MLNIHEVTCLVSHWACVLGIVVLALVGCGETTGAGGTGGSGRGGAGGVGGSAGSGGAAGDGGAGGRVAAPGALISAEKIDPFAAGMNAWRVLYGSEAIDGTPIEVSGIVAAPSEPPSEGLREVVAYAHGTTGLFDDCAISNNPLGWIFNTLVPLIVRHGYVAVVTDYEGLGTPGIHPYHVGVSEGRGVVDIVRAARQIDEALAGSRAVVWGISQGGHAALFAGEIAPDWAPEIEVLGVVPAAPSSELDVIFEERATVPDTRGNFWEITLAFEATYPDLNLEDLYDAETIGVIRELADDGACTGPFEEAAWDVENAGFVTNPVDIPRWREALVENSPGYVRSEMPILLLQGSADPIVARSITDILFGRLCEIGSHTDYRVFERFDHVQPLTSNLGAAFQWTAARFAGEPSSSTCPN